MGPPKSRNNSNILFAFSRLQSKRKRKSQYQILNRKSAKRYGLPSEFFIFYLFKNNSNKFLSLCYPLKVLIQRKESVEQPIEEQAETFKIKPKVDKRVEVHEESVTLERPRDETSGVEFSQEVTITQTKSVIEEYVYLESPEATAERIVPDEQPESEERFTSRPSKKQPEKLDSLDVTIEKVELKPEIESPKEEKFTLSKPRKSVSEPTEEQIEEIKITTRRKKSKSSISEDQKAETVIIKPSEERPAEESQVEVFKIKPKKPERKLSVEEQLVVLERPKSEAEESQEFTIRQTAVQEEQQIYEAPSESQTLKLEKSKKSKFLTTFSRD